MSVLARHRVGAVDFTVETFGEAVRAALDIADRRDPVRFHFANAWSVVLAQRDSKLSETLGSGITYPDGASVVIAMRVLTRGPSRDAVRVSGPSFFESVIKGGVARGTRHFLMGGTEETLVILARKLEAAHPGVIICGTHSPRFGDFDADAASAAVAAIDVGKPDIVWLGLGTPKQDQAAVDLIAMRPLPYACVGAAFDISAGRFVRAPRWMQRIGLEWLHRFAQEPRRLWRRYLIGNAAFLGIVVWQAFGRNTSDRCSDQPT